MKFKAPEQRSGSGAFLPVGVEVFHRLWHNWGENTTCNPRLRNCTPVYVVFHPELRYAVGHPICLLQRPGQRGLSAGHPLRRGYRRLCDLSRGVLPESEEMNVTPPAVFSAGGVTFKILVIASQLANWRGNPFSQTFVDTDYRGSDIGHCHGMTTAE